MTNTNPTAALSQAGVSIWLDDLSRSRITSGGLAKLIETHNVVGVTTNPTIFAGALTDGDSYASQVSELAQAGVGVEQAVETITTDDVRDGCDIFRSIYDETNGFDGRVSIEVSPTLAHDTEGTIASAKRLWATIDRPNALIKIPATKAGLPAITEVIGAGISVNVTLIFSQERYREVLLAYLAGLEKAQSAGIDLATIHSVASVFVSRVDAEVDARLEKIGSQQAKKLQGKAGIANVQLVYEIYEQVFGTARAQDLLNAGANRQRPLWASTGVKDPSLPDTLYVTGLVAPGVVNTMPEATLNAVADHGEVTGDTITGQYEAARQVLTDLANIGVDFNDVTQKLEDEGVSKFIVSWNELLETVTSALAASR